MSDTLRLSAFFSLLLMAAYVALAPQLAHLAEPQTRPGRFVSGFAADAKTPALPGSTGVLSLIR